MAYTLGNNCAKNCRKRTIIVQVIIEDVVTCFFSGHSVFLHYEHIGVFCWCFFNGTWETL